MAGAGRTEGSRTEASHWNLVLFAIWLGLHAWAAEYTMLSLRKFVLHQRWVWFLESVWLAALVYTLLFGLLGLAFGAIARTPRRRRLAFRILSGMAVFAVLLVFRQVHPLAWLALSAGIGYQLGSIFATREGTIIRLVRRTFPVIAGATAIIIGGLIAVPAIREHAAYASLPDADPEAPNVLLIILDTVRSRDLGLYGHDRPTTPHLEVFARRAVVFDRAISTSPWTLPSHYSILTGLYAHEMPAGLEYMPDPSVGERWLHISEVLAQRGYATAGFIANLTYATDDTGLDRGFIRWEDFTVSLGQAAISTAPGRALLNSPRLRRLLDWHEIPVRKNAARINRSMLDWIDDHQDRPFLILANYYDAHTPYLPPPAFSRAFVRQWPSAQMIYHPINVGWRNRRGHSAEEYQAQRDAYDGAIAWLDSELGRLFEALESRGLMENTLFVITSDHGEQFGEHGSLGHRIGEVHIELLHVPLIIRLAGRTPEAVRIGTPVSIADLAATVLDLVGVREQLVPGRSLARKWREENNESGSPLLSHWNTGYTKGGIILDGWHYVRAPDGTEALYHTHLDSLEAHDRSDDPAVARRLAMLRTALDSAMAITPEQRTGG